MNEYERRSVILTIYFFLTVALLTAAGVFLTSLPVERSRGTAFVAAFSFVFCLVMLWLSVRQLFWIPRLTLPLMTFLLGTYLAWANYGIHDEAILLYPLSIALAGLLYGRKGIVFYAFISVLTVFVMGLAEFHGYLITHSQIVITPIAIISVPILLTLTSVMMYLMVNYLNNVLENTRHNEHALADRNRELQMLQDSLENLVAERTRHAEAARQEAEEARLDAEAANRALEIQMWHISGQAQLNEVLREARGIGSLADSATSFLCRYLELPVGVLFVHRKQVLHLAGGYAYPHDLPSRFAQGEGLLGQAVLEKRTLILDSVPHTQMKVASALGQMAPRSVMLLPLIYNDQVVAVLELGALGDLSARAVQFLERAAESIAIAIHTVETRAEVDELLEKTQRQAKELQTQEKELRSANKRLLARTEQLQASARD
ncbi:MAG: GAF domain-containing protein [Chloroflexota bacterium]